VDIKIVYTGLRPGEKLYEELLMSEEGMTRTENNLIYIGHPIEMDDQKFARDLEDLFAECTKESSGIRRLVGRIVPTYHPMIPENTPDAKTALAKNKKPANKKSIGTLQIY
jgi:FlaA1/EpsC-like NDP-sugar epimerase